ncbi:MAG: hypothetical protein DMF61_02500 [Blastocatellia bacterium AA13]|nr:MAG: hypothetical protein DMF61_02500 [Blastocatellia bacterium AA13]
MTEPVRSVRYLFMNDEHELRSGWRLLIFIFVSFALQLLFSGIVGTLAVLSPALRFYLQLSPDAGVGRILIFYVLGSTINLGAILVSSLLCARLLERRGLASVGYKFHSGWARDFAVGIGIGAAGIGLAVAIERLCRAILFEQRINASSLLVLEGAALFALFIIAAAFEEMLARGFGFQALLHNVGPLPALALTSIAFGLLHINNEHASLFSTFNTVLAGLWLGVAYLKTRSLWLATALHASWNFTMVFVFGLPVSGITSFQNMSWLTGHSLIPTWVSGGDYGPEGGAAATIALVCLTLFVWKSKLFKPSEEMLEAIRHGKPSERYTTIFGEDSKRNSISGDSDSEG